MMKSITRRTFLSTSSLATTSLALSTVGVPRFGRACALPHNVARSRHPAEAWLTDPLAPSVLGALATRAVDAAIQEGASYADVRVAEQHLLSLRLMAFGLEPAVELTSTFAYGIRSIVDGAWAFVHGSVPTSDAVATSARNAVAMARGYARTIKRRVELAPAPAVKGEWSTPAREDPFTVPIRDQAPLMYALNNAVRRVPYVAIEGALDLLWTRETRVFASSEGTRTTQRLIRSEPRARFDANYLFGRVILPFPALEATSGGFETVSDPSMQDAIKEYAELVVRYAMLPRRTVDVGRYPVVFDGQTLGMLATRTLGSALELDRVLGYEADASGTSFLSPVSDYLGTTIAHPSLKIHCGRSMPSITAAKWDDEGVETAEYPLITQGKLVDYHTSRQTVSALKEWYDRQQLPVRLHGCMVARSADDAVLVRPPHMAVAPDASGAATIEELCNTMGKGILVIGRKTVLPNPQLSAGEVSDLSAYDGLMIEINKGQPVHRLEANAMQFNTGNLWKKQLVALGQASTVQPSAFEIDKGMPWRPVRQSASAPAGMFKDMNVISTNLSS